MNKDREILKFLKKHRRRYNHQNPSNSGINQYTTYNAPNNTTIIMQDGGGQSAAESTTTNDASAPPPDATRSNTLMLYQI